MAVVTTIEWGSPEHEWLESIPDSAWRVLEDQWEDDWEGGVIEITDPHWQTIWLLRTEQ